jgi:hypothetical protein
MDIMEVKSEPISVLESVLLAGMESTELPIEFVFKLVIQDIGLMGSLVCVTTSRLCVAIIPMLMLKQDFVSMALFVPLELTPIL